jgi:uncharacterized membrane-anchored protein
VILAAIFAIWYGVERTLSIHTIVTTRRELFYWAAILFTFALGTAAGDLTTEALMMGFVCPLRMMRATRTRKGVSAAKPRLRRPITGSPTM